MRRRIDQILLVVAIADAINTIVQIFTKTISLGLSQDTWLAIGLVIFFTVTLTMIVRIKNKVDKIPDVELRRWANEQRSKGPNYKK